MTKSQKFRFFQYLTPAALISCFCRFFEIWSEVIKFRFNFVFLIIFVDKYPRKVHFRLFVEKM